MTPEGSALQKFPVRDLSYSLAHFRELTLMSPARNNEPRLLLIKEKAIETATADKVIDKLELGNQSSQQSFCHAMRTRVASLEPTQKGGHRGTHL